MAWVWIESCDPALKIHKLTYHVEHYFQDGLSCNRKTETRQPCGLWPHGCGLEGDREKTTFQTRPEAKYTYCHCALLLPPLHCHVLSWPNKAIQLTSEEQNHVSISHSNAVHRKKSRPLNSIHNCRLILSNQTHFAGEGNAFRKTLHILCSQWQYLRENTRGNTKIVTTHILCSITFLFSSHLRHPSN